MYTETVVLTGHSSFEIDTRFGRKTKNVFTDTQGREFQVWKADLAAQLLATMGQQVTVQFEAKQNGEYVNYDVKGVALNGAVTGAQPGPVATAPPAQVAPQAAPPQQPAGENQAEKQLRIMRQNALGNAVLAFGAAGIDPVVNNAELLEFAEFLVDFYVNGRQETTGEVTVDTTAAAGPVA